MTQHPTGKRQHIVPQQMIRNFAGADGKLIEMVKPEMRIATRRRSPSGILFRDDFYRDRVSDFDAELLTPVEQKFAKVYPEVLGGASLDGHQGAAFVCWVAAMLVRTQLLTRVMPSFADGLPEPVAEHFDELKRLWDNMARSDWYEMYCDLFSRKGWKWKIRRSGSTEVDLILTDHPVCMTSVHQQGGQLVVVPMSRRVVLVGGAHKALERMRDAGVAHYNFFLLAWAQRHVFAAQRSTLQSAAALLSEDSSFPPELIEAAREPLFGVPARIRDRMRDEPMPDDFDFAGNLRLYAECFGPLRWEDDAPPDGAAGGG